MVPHHSIPNMIVKRDSGEDTWGVAPWENSTVPKFLKFLSIYILYNCKKGKIGELFNL
jgi:hypothetical protein